MGIGMKPEVLEQRLKEAERHVVDGKRHVEQQRLVLERLVGGSHATREARRLLHVLEELLVLHVQNRDGSAPTCAAGSTRSSSKRRGWPSPHEEIRAKKRCAGQGAPQHLSVYTGKSVQVRSCDRSRRRRRSCRIVRPTRAAPNMGSVAGIGTAAMLILPLMSCPALPAVTFNSR